MNWYRITPCPNYAISEDGQSVKNITTDQLLKHNSTPYAPDGLRRVTLRRTVVYKNHVGRMPKVYTVESLKQYIKPENKV